MSKVTIDRELLEDLHDLAADAVEHHRVACAGSKKERQARMDKTVAEASALLAAAPATPAGQEHAAEQLDTVGAPRKLLAEAESIIDSYAEALKQCHAPGGDWVGEEAAQDDYEHEAGVASELRAILAIAQIQERNQ